MDSGKIAMPERRCSRCPHCRCFNSPAGRARRNRRAWSEIDSSMTLTFLARREMVYGGQWTGWANPPARCCWCGSRGRDL